MASRRIFGLLVIFLALLWLVGCSAAATPAAEVKATQAPASEVQVTVEVVKTEVVTKEGEPVVVTPTAAPAVQASPTPIPATQSSQPTRETGSQAPTPLPPTPLAPAPTSTPFPTPGGVEARLLELEWPPEMRLGDSDVLRISLIPSQDGYTVRTDFPEHRTDVQPLDIPRPQGYDLYAVARLEGVGFDISPQAEQPYRLAAGQEISWMWSLQPRRAGTQRLVVTVLLRWAPVNTASSQVHETNLFSRALSIRVRSFFGLARSQAMTGGLLGLLFGGGLLAWGLAYQPGSLRKALQIGAPDPLLVIEPPPGLSISGEENALLRTLFRGYGRLILESEFLSGYSGARAFLARPVRTDGRSDAHTIIKVGEIAAMQQEYDNYEQYVKNTLPPITARIQQAPVAARGGAKAALQYTFIGTPVQRPLSLRQALLAEPNPALLRSLFETFGPNWWMQRQPYTFRLCLEYDRLLPTHLVLEPAAGRGIPLNGSSTPAALSLQKGDLVTLHSFAQRERRSDGKSLSLLGAPPAGQPGLRVRWLGLQEPEGATGRVVATRMDLLHGVTGDFDRCGLPDPLTALPGWLEETISGSQSTIHGDLNLENVLVGPGGFVWLIDFASTRTGHPLFDFAHLYESIIAQVIAPQVAEARAYLELLSAAQENQNDLPPLAQLLAELQDIAQKCQFNPSQPREWKLALALACLGGLKYENLDQHQKHLLYLTAAWLSK